MKVRQSALGQRACLVQAMPKAPQGITHRGKAGQDSSPSLLRHVNWRGSLARVQRVVAWYRREVAVLVDGVLAHLGRHALHPPPVRLIAFEHAGGGDRAEAQRALRDLLLALTHGRAGGVSKRGE